MTPASLAGGAASPIQRSPAPTTFVPCASCECPLVAPPGRPRAGRRSPRPSAGRPPPAPRRPSPARTARPLSIDEHLDHAGEAVDRLLRHRRRRVGLRVRIDAFTNAPARRRRSSLGIVTSTVKLRLSRSTIGFSRVMRPVNVSPGYDSVVSETVWPMRTSPPSAPAPAPTSLSGLSITRRKMVPRGEHPADLALGDLARRDDVAAPSSGRCPSGNRPGDRAGATDLRIDDLLAGRFDLGVLQPRHRQGRPGFQLGLDAVGRCHVRFGLDLLHLLGPMTRLVSSRRARSSTWRALSSRFRRTHHGRDLAQVELALAAQLGQADAGQLHLQAALRLVDGELVVDRLDRRTAGRPARRGRRRRGRRAARGPRPWRRSAPPRSPPACRRRRRAAAPSAVPPSRP